ncbi:MAG: dihydroneopterin aldolase [Firmicutes bacterium]|nr:dihydroneopterin aldolase [Bacillota bacterium]
MNSTKLTLKKMIFFGYHGVYAEERKLGQQIEVDVELVSDLTEAGLKDDLELTVNYVDVYEAVRKIVETEQFSLIEGMALAILNRLGKKYTLKSITVRVRKPQPPVGGVVEAAEFEISKEF